MILRTETASQATARRARSQCTHDEYVCWSRMQAEAGQPLEAIVARKEIERRAGGGLFLWGVGNPPAIIVRILARAKVPVRAVFSIMRSRPKLVDAAATRIVAWRRYIDAHGIDRPLPPHALVTSRGEGASGGTKRVHYALMCRCDEPLEVRRGEPFNPAAFRNAGGKGAPVGASQVTVLLRRVGEHSDASDYEVNLSAWLTESYWVKLTDPVPLDSAKLVALQAIPNLGLEKWCEVVADLRRGLPEMKEAIARGTLL